MPINPGRPSDSQDLGRAVGVVRKHWKAFVVIAGLLIQFGSLQAWSSSVDHDRSDMRAEIAQIKGELQSKASAATTARLDENLEHTRERLIGLIHELDKKTEKICSRVRCDR